MLIFVLDPHPLVGEMISMLILRIRPEARIIIVDSLKKLDGLMNKYETADFVFMEPQSVDCFGSTGIAHVVERLPDATIITITDCDTVMDAVDVKHQFRGSHHIISKKDNTKIICLKLEKILKTEKTEHFQDNKKINIIKISKRHRQLINCLDKGYTNQQISEKLGIKEQTVKVHFFRLYKLLGAHNRLQALNIAKVNGWISNSTF